MRRSPSSRLSSRLSEKVAARKVHAEKIAGLCAKAQAIVATGVCPDCGTALRRNLSLPGWWQCDAYGSPSFRRAENRDKPSCAFQTFTE